MSLIIIEGVLFVVLIATGAALLYFVVVQFTPVGVRLRQAQNRRRIDRAAELGPIHGPRAEKAGIEEYPIFMQALVLTKRPNEGSMPFGGTSHRFSTRT